MTARKVDLQKTIEDQQAKIDRYERKLRDVINAYRSVVTEKTALEESIKAFQSENSDDTGIKATENGDVSGKQEDDDERLSVCSSADTPVSENSNVTDNALPNTGDGHASRIQILRKALATITEEKSRQEAAFTADRRAILHEQAKLKTELSRCQEEASKSNVLLTQQLQELKASLRQCQLERECEQVDHVAMLKELQDKLSQTKNQLEASQNNVNTLTKKAQQNDSSQKRLNDALREITALKAELERSQAKLAEIPKQQAASQSELAREKEMHCLAVEAERTLVAEKSDELVRYKRENETRVANLENQIADVTSTLSEYERQRQIDLDMISKLRERITTLDQENTNLVKSMSSKNTDINSMMEEIKDLFENLRHKCNELHDNSSFTKFCDRILNDEIIHSNCRLEYETLKEEFEKYKMRAQTALKTKSSAKVNSSDNEEVDQLRRAIRTLQQKLSETEQQHLSTETELNRIIEELRRSTATLEHRHQRELSEIRDSCRRQIDEIESEASKQRERTLNVLEEKDKELDTMRVILRAVHAPTSETTDRDQKSLSRRGSVESMHSVANDSSASGAGLSSVDVAPSLYLNEELSRREKLIGQLKRDLRQMETMLRETEHVSVTKELQHYNTIERLKEEVLLLEGKLNRCQGGNSNLEYLKNVLLQYFACDDPAGRRHMLKAIGLSLQLSSKEMQLIQKQNYGLTSWWNSSAK